MNVQKYRKKPVVIDAFQFTGGAENGKAILAWMEADPLTAVHYEASGYAEAPEVLAIKTLEGTMRADVGDFIIKGMQGEFYPCKPNIFEATYERESQDSQ